jgi:hypothetical protein
MGDRVLVAPGSRRAKGIMRRIYAFMLPSITLQQYAAEPPLLGPYKLLAGKNERRGSDAFCLNVERSDTARHVNRRNRALGVAKLNFFVEKFRAVREPRPTKANSPYRFNWPAS